jgi:hypothetical protein
LSAVIVNQAITVIAAVLLDRQALSAIEHVWTP